MDRSSKRELAFKLIYSLEIQKQYDEETIEVEREIGIQAAVTTEYGISSANDGLYSLKRVRIFPMEIDSFKKIFNEFM